MGRYILIGIVLYTAAFFNTAYAGNAELMELINILRDNKTITQHQHDKLKQAVENGTQEAMKGNIDNGNAQKAEKDSGVDIKVSTKGGLEVATYDGNFSFELGGRFFIDGAYYNKDKNG